MRQRQMPNLGKLAEAKRKLIADMEANDTYCAPLTQATLRADIAALELGQKAVESLKKANAHLYKSYEEVAWDANDEQELKAAIDSAEEVLIESETE